MKNKFNKILALLCSVVLFILMFVINTSRLNAKENKPRFRDNKNGTITDIKTGLIWQQNGSAVDMLSWENAIKYCKNLRLAGFSDWRMPSIDELKVLLNITVGDGKIESEKNRHFFLNKNGFKNVMIFYWSGSNFTDKTDRAWSVNMIYGNVGDSLKYTYCYVIAVRSGQ